MNKSVSGRLFTETEVRRAVDAGVKAGNAAITTLALISGESEQEMRRVLGAPLNTMTFTIFEQLKLKEVDDGE